jgi:hypothetical protein
MIRKRTLRDLITLLGVIVIIATVALAKWSMETGDLRDRAIAWRKNIEEQRIESGVELLEWNVMQKTKGTLRSGPKYDEALMPHKGQVVDIVGYMEPLYEFSGAHQFLLLPMPLECYFCEQPPPRDVILVNMEGEERARMVEEPVMIHGQLRLNEGEGNNFFYVIENARMGAAEQGKTLEALTPQRPSQEALSHAAVTKMEEEQGELIEGSEPPAPVEEE